jgi:D-cysteine desulfhydrase
VPTTRESKIAGAGLGRMTAGAFPAPTLPTPVHHCGGLGTAAELWVKDDGRSHPVYGGNKVRKAVPLVEEARRRNARRVLTFGAVGSHHVLTMTLFARAAGLRTAAVLIPQPRSEHASQTVRASLGAGLEAYAASRSALVPLVFLRARRRGDYVVPPGGSNLVGTAAYADAVDELVLQIEQGALPAPDWIVAALGSGGTCAGIVAGVIRRRLPCRVMAVQVLPGFVPRAAVRRLARRVLETTGHADLAAEVGERITFDGGHLGRGYGFATEAGERATRVAAAHGLVLEQTYTAKAFAGALELLADPAARPDGRPLRVLYWHTFSAMPLDDLLAAAPGADALPAPVRRLLR